MGLRVPGPDPTDDLHAVSFGWLKRFLGWTAEIDFAGALNGALNAVPASAGAASEAASGVTQLSTIAEVLAGTVATKAVSPLNLLNARVATSLADLNNKAVAAAVGTIFVLTPQSFGANGLISTSIWYTEAAQGLSGAGVAQPMTPFIMASSTALPYLVSVVGVGKTFPNLTFDPGHTTASVGSDASRTAWTYIDSTTGFLRIQPLAAVNNAAFQYTGGFVQIPFTMPTGRDSEWSAAAAGYIVPRTGWYQIRAGLRLGDGSLIGNNLGLCAKINGNEATDRNLMTWMTVATASSASTTRTFIQAQRLVYAAKNTALNAEMYVDGTANAGITAGAATLEITPMGT